METVKTGIAFIFTMAFALLFALVAIPSPNQASLPVDGPNPHVLSKHSDAVKLFGKRDWDGWCRYDAPHLFQSLFCEKDPYATDDKEVVGGVFVGWDIVAGALVTFTITAFYAYAKYWRRVIERDGDRK